MEKFQHKIPIEEISLFCEKWKVIELALFGSILSEDFNDKSDIDVLVTFNPENQISLFDLAQMQFELQNIFNRPVDIIEKDALRNPFRKRHILENAQVIYET